MTRDIQVAIGWREAGKCLQNEHFSVTESCHLGDNRGVIERLFACAIGEDLLPASQRGCQGTLTPPVRVPPPSRRRARASAAQAPDIQESVTYDVKYIRGTEGTRGDNWDVKDTRDTPHPRCRRGIRDLTGDPRENLIQ